MSIPDRNFTLRLPDDVRGALEQRAAEEGMKPGTLARQVLKQVLKPVLVPRRPRPGAPGAAMSDQPPRRAAAGSR